MRQVKTGEKGRKTHEYSLITHGKSYPKANVSTFSLK